jgi:type II secretory pathway component PulJ
MNFEENDRESGSKCREHACCRIPDSRLLGTGSKKDGFILWEIMLALTIFCIVAIALTSALRQAIDASMVVRDEAQVRMELQNIVSEASATKLQVGKMEIRSGDGRIVYEREIRAVQGKTGRGEVLANLYEIIVRANWRTSGGDRTGQSDVVVFQP